MQDFGVLMEGGGQSGRAAADDHAGPAGVAEPVCLSHFSQRKNSVSERLNYAALAPEATRALSSFYAAAGSGLDRWLRELIDMRLSQINGCAFSMDMHAAALVKLGADPRHLYVLAGWRDASDHFSTAERAALAWVEAVNALPHRHPSDEEFENVRAHFDDAQVAEMTFAVGAIRAWNMLNASFRRPVPETPHVPAE